MSHKGTYKDQFKPMVKHEDAVLILSSEDDPEFVCKWTSCLCVNLFLADLIDEKFDSFDSYNRDSFYWCFQPVRLTLIQIHVKMVAISLPNFNLIIITTDVFSEGI